VLEPDDVHRLVASYLRDELGPTPRSSDDGYVTIRRLAEDRARVAAGEIGVGDVVGMPAVREQLIGLLGAGRSGADGPRVASSAIRREIQLHDDLWQANPVAHRLYRDAIAAGIAVAFLADSPLPRDLVTRMLQRAGYGRGIVLVSSQEGVTKASGALYATLADRVGEDPDRITHLGPDVDADRVSAVAAGVRALPVVDERRSVMNQIVAGLVDRTGVDAVALALAADRLAAVDAKPDLTDVGYYAGGPLATGFCAWTGRVITETEPDHVFFCGPAGRLLRQVTTTIRPDLAAVSMHELDGTDDGPSASSAIVELADQIDVRDGDRALAVDLGWGAQPHRWLADGLAENGTRLSVSGAYLGLLEPRSPSEPVGVWALTGADDCLLTSTARQRVEVLSTLLPSLQADFSANDSGSADSTARHQLATGVIQYAKDAAPWLAKLPDDSSRALAEPALRLVSSPSEAETELLAGVTGPWLDAEPSARPGRQPISRWRRRPLPMQQSLPPDEDRRT